MARTHGDPYWLAARFPGTCAKCKAPIPRGARAFYYPHGRSLYCAQADCGGAASADFAAAAADESVYHGGAY